MYGIMGSYPFLEVPYDMVLLCYGSLSIDYVYRLCFMMINAYIMPMLEIMLMTMLLSLIPIVYVLLSIFYVYEISLMCMKYL